ncbi:DNA polymerase III subunit gamma/tau [Marinobacterium aestuarii]|uniref:DNA polymerase III subunit gamma/tau n=1 Tax=Marinobacterium aestuarii TaxID=1821621 RepID=A0A1A9EXB8_9GAMM|nr:DNA polymerase III subunit gamma/tau [Marinobacterium aestuarii]ANG62462.1 DNA polymerase III subunit gamma/tau [Marinobacterium aestuarii]
MSYQVLARKWRPKRFQEMVGQEHVLKALVNALDDDRLHHAYLFTGTRGVGKTSIARLFAKSLNCEVGVSSDPCGQCSACREIAEGRFVDLIEVDAASRTKVEDTRELLENVQYAPTHGRYKVYLIDEVHMLSTHSFNALLKTLEEPPPHVKFLLATTDPQKLPVTILSRCLQFNLKNMIPERIVEHLRFVLGEENIPFEEAALWLLARSADGSMRDGMSLTDQAIAFGAGTITTLDVQTMLGSIDQMLVSRLLECLSARDAKALLAAVADLAQFSPDYASVLGDMISLLHRVAIAQVLPDAADNSLGDREQILALSRALTAEDVQLYYQIALLGRRDLPYVPDAREGLEMVLLRMLAFRPADAPAGPAPVSSAAANASSNASVNTGASASASPPVADTDAQVTNARVANVQAAQPVRNAAREAVVSRAEQALAVAPVAAPALAPEPVMTAAAAPVAAPAPAPVSESASQRVSAVSASARPDGSPEYDESDIPGGYDQGDADLAFMGVAPPKKSESAAVARPQSAPQGAAAPVTASGAGTVSGADTGRSEPASLQASRSAAAGSPVQPQSPSSSVPVSRPTQIAPVQARPLALDSLQADDWVALCTGLGLGGMTESLAVNLSLESVQGQNLRFHYTAQQQALLNEIQRERITKALRDYFAQPLEVEFECAAQGRETPHQFAQRQRELRQARAVAAIEQDPLVQDILQQFDAHIDIDTVVPLEPN